MDRAKQIYNPYLPLWEYVPDGEPHVFDGRVYIYGSHDRADGTAYCQGDYVTWSAPEDDLTDWRYEGVIYRKDQDPSNEDGKLELWAPDVTRGPDGRYYLYYCLEFYPEIGVAVSDSPAGPFEFYGHVHYPDQIMGGKTVAEDMPFDPAVLTDEDGRVYLYYGFAPAAEKAMILPEFTEEELDAMPAEMQKKMRTLKDLRFGENSMVAELEQDMVTLKEVPRPLIPGGNHTAGTGFEGHGFFEASSIRKVGKQYYFVYSSHKSHELCYAVSDRPDSGFRYGGILVSNGDIGLNGNEKPVNTLGNNHGGLAQINGEWYIFYHRQTNGTEFSRQGCAEKVRIDENGKIAQAEITSCGLNGKPLAGAGSYPSPIACHITSRSTMDRIDYDDPVMRTQTRITEQKNENYITDITDGTVIGYKYFRFDRPEDIMLEVRGVFKGTVIVSTESAVVDQEAEDEKADDLDETEKTGRKELSLDSRVWENIRIPGKMLRKGTFPLYLTFRGQGALDLRTVSFVERQTQAD